MDVEEDASVARDDNCRRRAQEMEKISTYVKSYVADELLVESTLLYVSVNNRDMISCIVFTWSIVRSCSKYIVHNC